MNINKEYEDTYADLKQELDKIGKINSLFIPREKDGHDKEALGNVFVEYTDEKYS